MIRQDAKHNTRLQLLRPLTDLSTVGGRLYLARCERGMSDRALALASGFGLGTIRDIECGTVTTTIFWIERMAIALDVDTDWLATGKVAA